MKKTLRLADMQAEAEGFAAGLKPRSERATLVTLSGDLGAGKTTFARAVARYFGIEDNFTSPTFVIEKMYMTETGPFERLIHIDVYRLETKEELETLRLGESLSDPKNLILLEWPERVEGALPKDAIKLTFAYVDDATRTIEYGS